MVCVNGTLNDNRDRYTITMEVFGIMQVTIVGHWGGYPKVDEASSGYLIEHEGF